MFQTRASKKLHLNGDEIEVKISEGRIISLGNGRKAFAFELLLPPLAIGIYELNFADDLQNSCRLIISPQSAYLPPKLEESKVFGFSVQLYALQTKNDQGIGDFSTLADTLEICQQNGASILAINPLHALFGALRDLKSPYYPSDRRFLDPIYIDISKFSPVGDFESQKQSKNVDYAGIWNKKREILLAKFQQEKSNSQFLSFCKNAPQALEDFALFEAIDWHFKGNWPQNLRIKNAKSIAAFKLENKDEINFQKYLQFIVQAQFKAASANGLEIGLNLDLAIGSAPNGSENWCNQELIANGISIGAPPDPLGPQGQIWGLPPYIPHKLLENKLCAIEEIYRANMKNAGALRIDHAMGLMRLFWVPDNMIGAMGAYVQNPFSHILRLTKLLSHEYKCLIIGEDLGTVPFGFSENMQSQNIFSYKVMPFEQDENGFKTPETYPENAFACAFTHDLPPLMGWWENVDIKTREDLGIFDNEAAKAALVSREREKNSILSALIKADLIDEKAEIENLSPKIFAAIHEYLGKCNSKIAIVQIEDLAQMKTMVNLPGTNMEYPNWQRKIMPNLHEIFANGQKLIVPSHIIAAISKNRE